MNRIAPKAVQPRKARKEKKSVQHEREITPAVTEHPMTILAAAETRTSENRHLFEGSFEDQTQLGDTLLRKADQPRRKNLTSKLNQTRPPW